MSKLRDILEYPTGETIEEAGVRFTPTEDGVSKYVVLRGGFRFQVEKPDGSWTKPAMNTVTTCASGPVVILYDPKTDIVGVTEEFRLPAYMRDIADVRMGKPPAHPPGKVMALTMGARDPGESMEDAAIREALEETGCTVGRLFKGPEVFSNQAISVDKIALFVAEFDSAKSQNDVQTGIDGEAGLIVFKMMQADDFLNRAAGGEFDAIGMAGAFFFQSRRDAIRDEWGVV